MTRIYTRTGDAGETGLFGGQRVPKDDVRVRAYGTVDEANAAIGVARAAGPAPAIDAVLERIQHHLFDLGAELATPPEATAAAAYVPRVVPAWVEALERDIDRFEDALPPLRTFILPGGTSLAAALHLARTVARRAEREVVSLAARSRSPRTCSGSSIACPTCCSSWRARPIATRVVRTPPGRRRADAVAGNVRTHFRGLPMAVPPRPPRGHGADAFLRGPFVETSTIAVR